MVASEVRKALAISAVVRPPSVRRVRATRACGRRAGWQQVKISRSRSSGIAGSASASSSSELGASASRPSSTSFFTRSVFSRRSRSIALLRATRVIQAPGLSGTPSLGQRSSATTKASWTASSAASKSPRTRIRLATARPDSWRNRRSTT